MSRRCRFPMPGLLAGSHALQSRLVPLGRPACLRLGRGSRLRQELDTIPTRIETIRPDGTGQTILREELYGGWNTEPAWSPDGARIVHSQPPTLGMRTINSSDGSGPAPVTEGDVPDGNPCPSRRSTRTCGRNPRRLSAFHSCPRPTPCTTPNREHGPPLAFGSCNPVQPGSTYLTVGVGDGSPALSRSVGSVRMDVKIGVPGPPDDSDVPLRFSLTNVMRASDLSEYTGELRSEMTVRRTDRDPPGARAAVDHHGLPVRLHGAMPPQRRAPASTPPPCTSFTSVNAVIPLAVEDTHPRDLGTRQAARLRRWPRRGRRHRRRQLAVHDAGSVRAVIATQGLFIP